MYVHEYSAVEPFMKLFVGMHTLIDTEEVRQTDRSLRVGWSRQADRVLFAIEIAYANDFSRVVPYPPKIESSSFTNA